MFVSKLGGRKDFSESRVAASAKITQPKDRGQVCQHNVIAYCQGRAFLATSKTLHLSPVHAALSFVLLALYLDLMR